MSITSLTVNLVLMRDVTKEHCGIRWNLIDRLEDLDYADDIYLISHSFADMQAKINCLIEIA